ncbi:MAG: hypothetical protein KTR30_05795, partial [Saprospiraceae bacterium]|nr:hypothetical protein [Saprospiraceae bacterium]
MISKNYFIKACQGMCLFLFAFLAMGMGEKFANSMETAAANEAAEMECPPVVASITVDNQVTCIGGADGQLTASGANAYGPVTYLWNTGATTATITGLTAGTYSVTVYDDDGCQGEDTAEETLTAQSTLAASIAVDNHASQATNDNGSLTATATPGAAPYTYDWSSGGSSATETGLAAGTYTVTITDNDGCTATANETIIQLATISGSLWLDLNQDGVRDDWEIGLGDIEVDLYECDADVKGSHVMEDYTDYDGDFDFTDVLPGEYCVEVVPDENYLFFLGVDYEVTTWSGTDGPVRTSSPSITVTDGELSDANNIGIFYDACYPPFLVEATECTEDGATLSWQTINLSEHDGVADHCWKIVVGGAGPQHAEFGILGLFLDYLGAGLHSSLIEISICADDPNLTVEDGDDPDTKKMTYVLSDDLIQPGTAYWFAVAEICDDMPSAGNTSIWNFQRLFALSPSDVFPFDAGDDDPEYEWDGYEGYFKTKDEQFTVEIEGIKPTCPEESEGYEEDGCIEITITDGSTCWGVYNIMIDGDLMEQSDSEEGGGDIAGFGQGTWTFCGYGVDTYTVSVEEVDNCNPPKSELIDDAVEVPNGMDMESPKIIVADFFAGGLIADNIDESETDDSADLGDMDIPEGACSMKSYFYVTGVDNCDGEICLSDAISYSVEGPGNIDPGTQVNIYEDSEEIDTGQGVVTVNGCEFIVEVNWAVGESTVTICLDDVEEAGLSDPACVTITANVIDNVEPTIVAQAANFVIPACSDVICGVYGFNIIDGCDDDFSFEDDITLAFEAELTLGFVVDDYVELENGYFEVLICFADDLGLVDTEGGIAGIMTVTYVDDEGDEYTSSPAIGITKAAEETDPVIIASGASFTALACEDGAEVVIGVTVTDDCDDITDDLKITGVDGLSAASPILNGLSGYFEFSGTLEPEE